MSTYCVTSADSDGGVRSDCYDTRAEAVRAFRVERQHLVEQNYITLSTDEEVPEVATYVNRFDQHVRVAIEEI